MNDLIFCNKINLTVLLNRYDMFLNMILGFQHKTDRE